MVPNPGTFPPVSITMDIAVFLFRAEVLRWFLALPLEVLRTRHIESRRSEICERLIALRFYPAHIHGSGLAAYREFVKINARAC